MATVHGRSPSTPYGCRGPVRLADMGSGEIHDQPGPARVFPGPSPCCSLQQVVDKAGQIWCTARFHRCSESARDPFFGCPTDSLSAIISTRYECRITLVAVFSPGSRRIGRVICLLCSRRPVHDVAALQGMWPAAWAALGPRTNDKSLPAVMGRCVRWHGRLGLSGRQPSNNGFWWKHLTLELGSGSCR